jgi:methylmalonyl-CoA/ethylmalonyl-CoA epimerase
MKKAIQPIFKGSFEQVCFVVNDVDKGMEKMWENFGIGPWNVAIIPADSITEVKYRGKPGRFGFKVGLIQVGGFEIELIESIEGQNVYVDFLKEHGEGVHHLGCTESDSFETFNKTIQDMEKAGFPCIMTGRCQPGYFAYFDTTKVLNTNLEIHWRDPKGFMPPFDYKYPEK